MVLRGRRRQGSEMTRVEGSVAGLAIATALMCLAAPVPASAQTMNDAISSRVQNDGKSRLLAEAKELIYDNEKNVVTASGDAELHYQGRTLQADRVVYDRKSGRVTGRLPSGPDPETFALSPDGTRLFVANENDNLLTIVDVAARKAVAEVAVGGEPEGTAVSPDGKLVVQTSESGSAAHLVNAATGEVIDNLLVDARPRFVAFTPDGTHFWVSSEARGTITVFDTATRKRVGRIDFQAARLLEPTSDTFVQPVGIAFTRDGRRAFVGLGRAKLVAEVDAATLKIVRTWPVGWRAWNVALSPDEKRLYTANGLSGDVTAIDLVANRIVGTVAVGGKPWGIVAAP